MKNKQAQVILEFTFCFIIVLLLLYGCLMAFKWAGVGLAARQKQHEDVLFEPIGSEQWVSWEDGPLRQIKPDFANSVAMNMVFNGW